jgi:hypothetical protein
MAGATAVVSLSPVPGVMFRGCSELQRVCSQSGSVVIARPKGFSGRGQACERILMELPAFYTSEI